MTSMPDWTILDICKDIAITLPGPETDVLSEKARQWGIYIIAQAKVIEPEIVKDRFFNTAFIIDPNGEIIHRHRKSRVFTAEGSTTPFDVLDVWEEKVGKDLQAFYPVVDTPIGRIGTLVCFEGRFPESGRLLALNGAEIIYRASQVEFHTNMGYWELQNRGPCHEQLLLRRLPQQRSQVLLDRCESNFRHGICWGKIYDHQLSGTDHVGVPWDQRVLCRGADQY